MKKELNGNSCNLKGDVKDVTEELNRNRYLTVHEYITLKRIEAAERRQLDALFNK